MKTILNFISEWVWQLPQNLLGILVIALTQARHAQLLDYWWTDKFSFGVSLGDYIVFGFKKTSEILYYAQS